MNVLEKLADLGLCNPPGCVRSGNHYLTIMGSNAYGVNEGTSDFDVYGFVIPAKAVVFPHLAGEIPGFGTQGQRFDQWQQHHIWWQGDQGGKGRMYDFQVYSIVRYFQLALENNPNMIDSLFTPQDCVLFATLIGQKVRQNRRIFLHKGCWPKFKGYAYQQMKKMRSQNRVGKRKEVVEEYGFDLKFAYHIVRLLNEVEQILIEGDLDLRRNREQLKSIRKGDWTLEQIENYFVEKESRLEELYAKSSLPYNSKDGPEEKVRALLLECLEMHYGSLRDCIGMEQDVMAALRQINEVCCLTISKYEKPSLEVATEELV